MSFDDYLESCASLPPYVGSCKTCGKDGEEECDECFFIRRVTEVGELKLVLRHSYYHNTFECTLEEYDLGEPIGYGNSIQEAIDQYLEFKEHKTDVPAGMLMYKWRGRRINEY